MTTASIYYNRHTGDPDYVLINGDRADVVPVSNVMGGDWKLRDVGAACRRLGWKVMGEAKIVRQADGRGTVVIEPLAPHSGPPDFIPADPVQAMRTGTAYVSQAASPDEPDVYTVIVAVDGLRETYTTAADIGNLDPAVDVAARAKVDDTLTEMGYVRSGPLVQDRPETWCCTADPAAQVVTSHAEMTVAGRVKLAPVAHIAVNQPGVPTSVTVNGPRGGWEPVHTLCDLTSPLPDNQARAVAAVDEALSRIGYVRTDVIRPDHDNDSWQVAVVSKEPDGEDWRDAVTLVRMDDDTADLLTRAASKLGIPADKLAVAWILRSATDALGRYERFMSPGYIADHLRIKGWLPDGSPQLED